MSLYYILGFTILLEIRGKKYNKFISKDDLMCIKNLKCVDECLSNNTRAFLQCVLQDFTGALLITLSFIDWIFWLLQCILIAFAILLD